MYLTHFCNSYCNNLLINDSDYQYAVSIKEDTAYPCLHSPKTTKERRSIRRIQKKSIRRIEDIVCEYSGRYQTWSLLQETPIRRIQSLGYAHFKTPSLDELRSPGVNLFSNQEDYSEEEVAVSRPKIKDRDHFELKGQFLKELQENTFNGSNHEDANEHIEKVLEIVDLFHVPNITQDQLMLRVFPISLTRAASRWLRNESTGSIKT
ncbi:hypothetical protein Tco_0466569 [Tanacetum coccineum]